MCKTAECATAGTTVRLIHLNYTCTIHTTHIYIHTYTHIHKSLEKFSNDIHKGIVISQFFPFSKLFSRKEKKNNIKGNYSRNKKRAI